MPSRQPPILTVLHLRGSPNLHDAEADIHLSLLYTGYTLDTISTKCFLLGFYSIRGIVNVGSMECLLS